MRFFRSEERVGAWCRQRGVEPGPIVSMPQLWGLASLWFSQRLTPEWRRPTPAEVRQVFASLGLTQSFWDPEADPGISASRPPE